MSQGEKRKKDPLLAAAVIKVGLELRGTQASMFKEIYEGVLRDFGLTDEQVDAYIEANREELIRLARGGKPAGE